MNELVDGEQLHGRDAELFQVFDGRLRPESGVRPAKGLRHLGVPDGEALHVQLVDNGSAPLGPRRLIVAPGEGVVDDRRQRRQMGIVAGVEGQVGLRIAHPIREHFVGPLRLPNDRLGVGVEENLVRVEAVPFLRLVGPGDAVSVNLPGQDVGQIAVPDKVGSLRQGKPAGLVGGVGRVEQT